MEDLIYMGELEALRQGMAQLREKLIGASDAPAKHGRWEMKPDPYGFFDEIPVCSACGCTTK